MKPIHSLESTFAGALAIAFFAAITLPPAASQGSPTWREWNRPVEPFRVVGNIYYVGASGVTSFLITSPQGHILLDSGFRETVPQIEANVKKLGFLMKDVKILLNSHSHLDHAAGLAELKRATGAHLVASEADAKQLAAGGKGDFAWGDSMTFEPARADRLIRDGQTVSVGGVTLTAHLTPGHTKGCTTWTMDVPDHGRSYKVVFVCSTTAPGYRLVDNSNYPQIASDYERTFRALESLPCDVFLAPHAGFFHMEEKLQKLKSGAKSNPFVDPEGYRAYLKESRDDFDKLLREQKSGH